MVVPVACHFEGDIEDLSVQLSVTQRFVNAGSEPLEAAYSWPLHHTFSCIGLKATIMSEDHPPRVIVGRIMQKAGAKQVISCCNQWGFMLYLLQAYDQAVGDNHSACLLQQSAARSDCALVNVGSVGPGTEALISALWMMVCLSLHLFDPKVLKTKISHTHSLILSSPFQALIHSLALHLDLASSGPLSFAFSRTHLLSGIFKLCGSRNFSPASNDLDRTC